MTKMTKEQLLNILRKRIDRYEKSWNDLYLAGDRSSADRMDGREHEAQEILWLLEEIEII